VTRQTPHRGRISSEGTLAQTALSVSCLASGTALVLTIVLQRPLWATLSVTAAAVCTGAAAIWLRSALPVRAALTARLKFGLVAGLVSTAAYDAARWSLKLSLGLRVSPFGALPFFGGSLLGATASPQSAWLAGFVYHVSNGMLFGAAYTVFLGHRRWWLGIVWSLALEGAMLTFYPMWLDLRAVMNEFTLMSVTGHLAYGAVLGLAGERRFGRPD
jgi:hypothetical protein